MEPLRATPEQTSAPPNRRRSPPLRLVFLAFGLPVLAFVVLLIVAKISLRSKVVWLTPQEMDRLLQPEPLTPLQHKLMNMTFRLREHFHSGGPCYLIASSLFELSATAAQQTGLGPPAATNAQGVRVWILPPAQSRELKLRLGTLPGAVPLGSYPVPVDDGSTVVISLGPSVSLPWTNRWGGLKVIPTPNLFGNSCRLTIDVPWPGLADWSNNPSATGTNFFWLSSAASQRGYPSPGSGQRLLVVYLGDLV